MVGIDKSVNRDTFTVEDMRNLDSLPFEFWDALLDAFEKAFVDERKRGDER